MGFGNFVSCYNLDSSLPLSKTNKGIFSRIVQIIGLIFVCDVYFCLPIIFIFVSSCLCFGRRVQRTTRARHESSVNLPLWTRIAYVACYHSTSSQVHSLQLSMLLGIFVSGVRWNEILVHMDNIFRWCRLLSWVCRSLRNETAHMNRLWKARDQIREEFIKSAIQVFDAFIGKVIDDEKSSKPCQSSVPYQRLFVTLSRQTVINQVLETVSEDDICTFDEDIEEIRRSKEIQYSFGGVTLSKAIWKALEVEKLKVELSPYHQEQLHFNWILLGSSWIPYCCIYNGIRAQGTPISGCPRDPTAIVSDFGGLTPEFLCTLKDVPHYMRLELHANMMGITRKYDML